MSGAEQEVGPPRISLDDGDADLEAPRPDGPSRTPPGRRIDLDLAGLMLLLTLALGAGFPYFEQIRNANERPRLVQSMALVDSGSWAIDGPSRRRLALGPDIARAPDGRLYPNKPPGASVVGAAAYVTARGLCWSLDEPLTLRHFTWWARLLAGLLPTLLLCRFAARRYAPVMGPAPAVVAVLIYALASPAASYAHLFYGHQLAAALLFAGSCLLVDAVRLGRQDAALAGGLLAGAAVPVEYGAVFAAVPIGAMLLFEAARSHGFAVLGLALVGALIPVGLLAWYQDAVFGSMLATGYHHAADPGFAEKHSIGLLGLTRPTWEGIWTHALAPDGGVLWWMPWLVPAGYGAWLAFRDDHARMRAEAALTLSIFALVFLVGTGLSFDGGWRVGPRYLVVALPMLIPGLARALQEARTTPWLAGVIAAAATWSVVANALAANLWPHLDLTNVHSPLAEVLIPLLEGGQQPYSPISYLGMNGGGVVLVLLSCVAVVVGLYRCLGPDRPVLTATTAGGVAGLVAVVTVPGFIAPHEKGERNLQYIERVYEPGDGGKAGKTRELEPLKGQRGVPK